MILFFVVIFTLIHFLDKNQGKIVWFKRRDLRYGLRGGIFVVIFAIFTFYIASAGTVGSVSNSFNQFMGDKPAMWDSVYDAQLNGPLVAFMRQVLSLIHI